MQSFDDELAAANSRIAELEATVRQQEHKLLNLIEAIPLSVIIVDQNQTIVGANTFIQKMFGYKVEELIGQPLEIVIPERSRTKHHSYTQAYFEAPHIRPMAPGYFLSGRRKDGSEFPIEVGLSFWETDGNKVALSFISDVTTRYRAEMEREHLIQELKVANDLAQETVRLKSDFLSIISHELRTPLNIIEGNASLMLSGIGGELEGKTRQRVERIHDSGKNLQRLVEDLLIMSQIDVKGLNIANLSISIASMVTEWQSRLHEVADKKHIEFIVKLSPDMPQVIYGDQETISKIALRLLDNAFKFTAEGGTVTLEIICYKTAWVIQVSDTGIGIPRDAQSIIFEEFRQADSSATRLHGGLGLGLAVVRKLALVMGGTITFESEVGQGSTFSVTLPMYTQPH